MAVEATGKITLNDIRARILRLPRDVRDVLPDSVHALDIRLEHAAETDTLTISSNRAYLGGVTGLFRRAGVLRTDREAPEGRVSEVEWSVEPEAVSARVTIAPVEDWAPLTRSASADEEHVSASTLAALEEAEEELAGVTIAHRAFFVPIVRAIAELGGQARKRDMIRKIRTLLADELNDKQLDYLEAKKRYEWARNDLKRVGLLGGEYGTWALTELGAAYEARHRDDEIAIPMDIPEADVPAQSSVKTETVPVTGGRGYEIPLLRAMNDGTTNNKAILERMHAALKPVLLEGDHRMMPANVPVWEFRASWALSNLGKAGHAENTGIGEWTITEAGCERLKREGERWRADAFHGSRAKVRVDTSSGTAAGLEPLNAEAWESARRDIGKALHARLTARLRPELGPTPDPAIPRNVILYGPPGTGKTYLAKAVAGALSGQQNASENGRFRLVQFHPSYAYEDFVQGLRPDLNQTDLRYKLHEGPFQRIAEAAAQEPDAFYVLVIDEINRGDPARIFGELLYSLEYRDEAVTLPMGGELIVPANLVIVGTMNSADRSVALVDYALRRRFGFIRVDPDPTVIQKIRTSGVLAETGPAVLEEFNAWVRKRLGREYQLGHSYFLSPALPEESDDIFDRLWAMDIAPLLEEYFFGDDGGLAEAERVWRRIVSEEAATRAEVQQESQQEDAQDQ